MNLLKIAFEGEKYVLFGQISIEICRYIRGNIGIEISGSCAINDAATT